MPLTRYEHVSGSAREHARNVVAEQYAAGATVRMIADDLGAPTASSTACCWKPGSS